MSKRTKIAAIVVAALATVGTGAAIAATKAGSPQEESQAIVEDAAKQLGVAPEKLSAALKQALVNRLSAAVAEGRLTQAQADALKERIQSGNVPLFAGRHGPHGDHHLGLEAAAGYLGVSADELRSSLSAGKTLADVAREKGKSVDGLVAAMVSAAKERLDQAVADGRLTSAQRDEIASRLQERISELVENGRPAPPARFGFRGAA
jgi:hypothetical protein